MIFHTDDDNLFMLVLFRISVAVENYSSYYKYHFIRLPFQSATSGIPITSSNLLHNVSKHISFYDQWSDHHEDCIDLSPFQTVEVTDPNNDHLTSQIHNSGFVIGFK